MATGRCHLCPWTTTAKTRPAAELKWRKHWASRHADTDMHTKEGK